MSKNEIKNKVKELAEKYGFIFVDGYKFTKTKSHLYICYPYYRNLNYDYLTDTLFSTFISIDNIDSIIVIMYNVTDLETETMHYKTIKNFDLITMEKHLQKNLKKLKELKTENKIKEIDKDFE